MIKTKLKVSEFLAKKDIKPFVYGAFLNRIMETTNNDTKYFYAYTSFKSSKAVYKDDFNFFNYSNELLGSLNHHSGYYNWEVHSVSETAMELRFYLINDMELSITAFYKLLYNKMMSQDWVVSDEMTEEQKEFIRGFMELRGSVDTTAKLIAQDYFYNNRIELKKAQIITDTMNLPISCANFNARNLQPQFVSGENMRNAQFRINLFYYAKNIGFINKYKAQIFDNSYSNNGRIIKDDIIYFNVNLPKTNRDTIKFIEYINFFTNNIYEKQLTPQTIATLRQKLGFLVDSEAREKQNRNKTIVEIFREISEDKCAICGTTQTFFNRSTNRQHFEIHHVISYKNGYQFDNIANLVKLCPTCHNSLKKNLASKDDQVKSIIKILHNHPEVYDFTSSYLQEDDILKLAEQIWEMLG